MELVWPAKSFLAGYVQALERGWSPDTMRPEAAREELAAIERDADGFLSALVDRDAIGGPVTLPNGSTVDRLPGYRRWMWDGEFGGSIDFRWQPGTPELPSHVPGHIGFSVVPWKRRRGYARRALGLMLVDAAAEGLDGVEVTTDVDNIASQRVIEANGGVLIERFVDDDPPAGSPEERTLVDADLSEPGAVAPPDAVGPDPDLGEAAQRGRVISSGDTIEPGVTERYELDVHCGIEVLGELNDSWWRTDEALGWNSSDLPDAWQPLLEDVEKIEVEVLLTTGQPPSIEATANGHTVTYHPADDVPMCD